jgi:carbamoyl-phosphate synthase small subunit
LHKKAICVFDDGTYLQGKGFGAETRAIGEVVFNTAMLGYEEAITDPSYLGQILLFTTPYIGNTGITLQDVQSNCFFPEGLIVRNISPIFDNFRGRLTLEEFLIKNRKCCIYGIDTRALTIKIRDAGCSFAIISTFQDDTVENLKEILNKYLANIENKHQDLYYGKRGIPYLNEKYNANNKEKLKIALIDLGVKRGIKNCLESRNCQIYDYDDNINILDLENLHPDGVVISNGPGDPQFYQDHPFLTCLQDILNIYPTFGICLGHQLIGLAKGMKIKKLFYGHHGNNHPIINIDPSKEKNTIEITSQNHNYVIDNKSVPKDFIITHQHLIDGTIAGLKHSVLPILSVQYHPEASPGPHDSLYLFDDFINIIEKRKNEAIKFI